MYEAHASLIAKYTGFQATSANQQPEKAERPADRGRQSVGIALATEAKVRIADAESFTQYRQVGAVLAGLDQAVGQAAPI